MGSAAYRCTKLRSGRVNLAVFEQALVIIDFIAPDHSLFKLNKEVK